jgi:very-short-patch-repair endonuclease
VSHIDRPHADERVLPRLWCDARELAASQENVISLGQLKDCGVSKAMVGRAVRTGRLQMSGGEIYCMGAVPPSSRGRCWAALLRGGEESALSHRTAAVLWALIRDHGPVIHVTNRTHRRQRPGTAVHQASLDPQDVTRRDGLRVTSLARTLLDLAATEIEAILLVAVRQALTLHKRRKRSIFAILERAGGHPGRGPLRRALGLLAADPGSGDSRGSLEDAFWLALLPFAHLIPPYQRNRQIRGPGDEVYLGDIVFAKQRVVVELDARDHHDNDPAFDSDRRRDLRLIASGWIVIRITPRHLRDDAATVVADLLATLAART